MKESERIELTVLGQTLTLRSEADPAYLRSLAAALEARVAELQRGGVRDVFKALILVALDMTDELQRADQLRDAGDVAARLGALVKLLDSVAPDPPPRRA
jgi:cell division protein ZapA (FtsZ GTPase activity inhibitor)